MPTPIHVLILEDNPDDADLVLHALRKSGFTPLWHRVDTEAGYLAHLEHQPDIILADFAMPQFNALRALALLQERALDIPLIIVSGTIGEEVAVECMRLGATDYLLKDRLIRLGQAVTRALEAKRIREEKMQAEEALRESEERFRSTFEQAAVGIAHVSPDGHYLRLNQRFCEIVGYTHAELMTHTFQDITHPDDLDSDLADMEQVLSGAIQSRSKEKRYVRKDGSVVWINLTGSLLRGPTGEPKYLITVIEDISGRKRLEETEREHRALAEALAEVAARLNSTLDLEEVLEHILENLERVAPHDSANVMFVESSIAHVVRRRDLIDLGDEEKTNWGIAETPTLRQMAEKREPLAITDTQASSLWVPIIPWVRSYAGAPICQDEEVIGFINLNGATSNMFTTEHAQHLQAFADQAAVAIQNAQLFGQTRQRAAYLAALNDASHRVSRWGLDLDGVLQAIVTTLTERVGAALARIWLTDETGEDLILRASAGLSTRLDGELTRFRIADYPGHVGLIARERQPMLLNHIQGHALFDQEWIEEYGLISFAGYPLHKNDHLIAVLTTFSLEPLDRALLDMLGSFANQAAIAIENAKLYHELETYSGILEEAVEERTAELQQTKERVETILNYSPDPILLLKPNGSIEAANPAFQRVFGYHVDELYGLPPLTLIAANHAGLMRDALLNAIDKRTVMRQELILQRKDGTTFDAEVALAPIRKGQKLLGVVCSLRDISVLKEVARMKDDFVSNVSHELRTPITCMKLNHRLIAMYPEKSTTYLERLGREIDRLDTLIEDLLRLSRLDQGRVLLDVKPTDFNTLADQYVNDRTPLAESRNLTLSFEASANLPEIQVDEGLVGQVLSVLLTNAINYTPAGGQVTVRTRTDRFDGKQWVGFSISDSGPGIVTDDQPHLFERFYRGKAGYESGVPGTGLGLAIAQEIVARHQGRIEVESEGIPGQGATFTVWLPKKESITEADSLPPSAT